MSPTGVVAALRAEARTLGPLRQRAAAHARLGERGVGCLADGTLVAVSGIGNGAAAAAADALIDAGAKALVSWGMAGGLDPRLRAGTICLPETVLADDGARYVTQLSWRNSLRYALGERRTVVGGALVTSLRAIDTTGAKAAAFAATGAVAVDMESASIARVAAVGGLPFIAVRVVVDTAADALPASVTDASIAGQIHLWRLLCGLARSPAAVGALLRLAKRYRDAIHGLRVVAGSDALAAVVLP